MTRRNFFSLTPVLSITLIASSSALAQAPPPLPGTTVTSAKGTVKSKVRRGYICTNLTQRIFDSPYLTVSAPAAEGNSSAELIPTSAGSHDAFVRVTHTWDLDIENQNPPTEGAEIELPGLAPPIPELDYALCNLNASANVNTAGDLATSTLNLTIPVNKQAIASASHPDKLSDSKSDGYFQLLTSPRPLFVKFQATIGLSVIRP